MKGIEDLQADVSEVQALGPRRTQQPAETTQAGPVGP